MAFPIIITDAGRAAIINAQHNGAGPVLLSQIALGTGNYTPKPDRLALANEFKRLSTIGGAVVAPDTIHVTIKDESADAYTVNEFGIFTDGGVLFAVYSAPAGTVTAKAAPSVMMLAFDMVLASVAAGAVTFGAPQFNNPPATTTVVGVVALATQAEANDGVDNTKAITPKTMAGKLLSYAPLDSPPLVGKPTTPTAADRTETTQIASTAFVMGNTMSVRGSLAATAGTHDLNDYATTGIYHQANNSGASSNANYPVGLAGKLTVFTFGGMTYQTYHEYQSGGIWFRSKYSATWYAWRKLAALDSPVFTGSPKAPTAPSGDNTSNIANTAFARSLIGGQIGINVAGGVDVVLTSIQAGYGVLTFIGALTANINVIVPAWEAKWKIYNATTGAFRLTVKTASGSGVLVSQGRRSSVWCDTLNVYPQQDDFIDTVLSGAPTATTAAKGTSNKQVANAEFVQGAIGNYSGHFGYTKDQTLTAAQCGSLIQFYGDASGTFTLPLGAGCPLGGAFHIYNHSTAILQVTTQGGDYIYDVGNKQPVVLQPGDNLIVGSRASAEWDLIGGTAGLQFSATRGVTAPQFDVSASLATMAAVQRALGSFRSSVPYTVNTNLTEADVGSILVAGASNGAMTWTCPNMAAITTLGASITIVNMSGYPLTLVQQNAADRFISTTDPSGTATSFKVPNGSMVTISRYTSRMWLVSGSGSDFKAQLANPGYQRLPSGLIIQWGAVGVPQSNGQQTATVDGAFPIAFPNGCMFFIAGANGYTLAPGANAYVGGGALSNALFRVQSNYTASNIGALWFAIGI